MNGQIQAEAVLPVQAPKDKHFTRNKWFFTVPAIGIGLSYQLVSIFLFTYIQFGFSLSVAQFTALSIIIGIGGRIWDAMNDPMMGAIIDSSHFKSGKFRPWILMGVLSCGFFTIVMFNVQNFTGWAFVIFLSIIYFLWESTCTVVDIGYWAMLPSLTSDKIKRNKLTSLTVVFTGLCGMVASTVVPQFTVGDIRSGYANVSTGLMVFSIICGLILFLGIKETGRPAAKAEEKSSEKISFKDMLKTILHNDQVLWISLSFIFYCIGNSLVFSFFPNYVYMELGYDGSLYLLLVLTYGLSNLLISSVFPLFANKISRKNMQLIGVLILTVGYIGILTIGLIEAVPVVLGILVSSSLVAIGQGMFYLVTLVNYSNCIEYNEYKHGERKEAVLTTMRAFVWKLSTAVTALILTFVLAVSGIYGLSQSVSTLETQKNYFSKMQTRADQVAYIEKIQSYLSVFKGLSKDSKEYENAIKQVSTMLENDETMSRYQLTVDYIPALSDAMVLSYSSNAQGVEATEVGRLSEVNPNALKNLSDNSTLAIEIGNLKSGKESAANLNFRDKSTMEMRIWLRVAAAVIPALFLIISWIIQRRKIIIDEKYYEMMMNELESRKAALPEKA